MTAFVMGKSMASMPAHRVFRHMWRDSTCLEAAHEEGKGQMEISRSWVAGPHDVNRVPSYPSGTFSFLLPHTQSLW